MSQAKERTYNLIFRRVRVTNVAVEKHYVLHIPSVFVCVFVFVALIIQHAKSMRRIVLISVACLAAPYFPHYLINGKSFRRNVLNRKYLFCFSLQNSYKSFIIPTIFEGSMINDIRGLEL